jgi:hypothetical protein
MAELGPWAPLLTVMQTEHRAYTYVQVAAIFERFGTFRLLQTWAKRTKQITKRNSEHNM